MWNTILRMCRSPLDPTDPKNHLYLAVVGGAVLAGILYFFREQQHEIMWKDFIQVYLQRGLVSIHATKLATIVMYILCCNTK